MVTRKVTPFFSKQNKKKGDTNSKATQFEENDTGEWGLLHPLNLNSHESDGSAMIDRRCIVTRSI